MNARCGIASGLTARTTADGSSPRGSCQRRARSRVPHGPPAGNHVVRDRPSKSCHSPGETSVLRKSQMS
jgi:hypothetical protein